MFKKNSILQGDSLELLKKIPDKSIDLVFADPPYNLQLRDTLYRPDQTTVEAVTNDWDKFDNYQAYDEFCMIWLKECKRVLKDGGALWVIGSYHNILRLGTSIQNLGFWILNDIIWHKTNPMPIPVKDRPTSCHEHIFLLSKSQRYYYDKDAILEPLKDPNRKDPPTSAGFGGNKHTGNKDKTLNNAYSGTKYDATKLKGKNKRDVWTVATNGYKGAHFAVYPPKLIEPCILAGCPDGGIVLDPFSGSGTTGVVAMNNNKKYIGIELNPEFAELSHQRIKDQVPNTLVEHLSD